MGYDISQQDTQFHIAATNKPAALEAVRALADDRSDYAWVDETFALAKTLETALTAWRWEPQVATDAHAGPPPVSSGDIIHVSFSGEKLGDDADLWDALAPFVTPGSFIQVCGEDGAMWRWCFDATGCYEVSPTWVMER